MGFGERLGRLYFDLLYHRVYDLTTAGLTSYRRALGGCVNKLELAGGDRVLCVGVGTGNEVRCILSKEASVHVVGVDVSPVALQKARQKAAREGSSIALCCMDAQALGFADMTFDKALCVHVMGFLEDDGRATAEIMRVLKDGAQFVITFPSGGGLLKLGGECARSIGHKFRSGRWQEAAKELLSLIGAGIINIPVCLWVKPAKGFYSRQRLETMPAEYGFTRDGMEEDRIYQEFVISGMRRRAAADGI